ncbi:arylsulfatase [Novosphingobium sp. P6W]|uniref:arylsulfatase n=1 Tax=Novosphingobium sp. P6W TaxID=1609758 RepID=UPI0009E22C81|nr:arylsulfatase [Novosphingobium sp. P6W]AXB75857.1 arylsulfatase [Novosphingobium sp. P6W]
MVSHLSRRLRRARFACSAAVLVLAGLAAPVAFAKALGTPLGSQSSKPDIILIVLDDTGFSDLGAFGSEIRTPNIDALAARGLRYNHFDSKAVCSPTRASLMTGRNPQTVRMADLPARVLDPSDLTRDRGELPQNASTIAQVLHRAGYATHGYGKWHLAPESEDGSPGHNGSWPLQRGFDDFYGFFLGWSDQYHPKLIEGNRRLASPNAPGYHFSVDITDHAIKALDEGRDKPQFVYLAFGAAHAPIQVPKPYIDAYAGVFEKGWDALRVDRLARQKLMGIMPPQAELTPRAASDRAWSDLTATEKTVFARFMATYAGFITHTDEQIGRLVQHLKDTGRFDNTLIVLVTDNGAASEAGQKGSFERLYAPNTLTPEQMLARLDELGSDKTQSEYQRPWAYLGATPYKRYKLWPQLGGVRTPMVVSWPNRIHDGGKVRTQYVDAVDIAPTLAAAAGTAFPKTVEGKAEIPVAGASILPTIGNPAAPAARTVQYFELRGNRAITQGKWRALAIHPRDDDFEKDVWQLYDTDADPSENHDLAAQMPAKVKELKALWWSEARKYSNPPLAEAPKAFRYREMFDGSPDRTEPVVNEGEK